MATRIVCPTDHKHAENSTCYIAHRCGCIGCREGDRLRTRKRERAQLYGRWESPLVDAEPVREHIAYLRASGVGKVQISVLSGVGKTAVDSLIYGRKGSRSDARHGELVKRVSREKAAAILAVRPDMSSLADGVMVSSRGVHRRIQALVARGWSMSKLAVRLDIRISNFVTMMKRPMVRVSLHRQVDALYQELWNKVPDHASHYELIAFNRSVAYAAARRWVAPMAWDDIDNDPEPPVQGDEGGIDEMAVQLALEGEKVRLSVQERREAVRRLHVRRLSDGEIAKRLSMADRTSFRIRQELGLPAAVGADRQVIV